MSLEKYELFTTNICQNHLKFNQETIKIMSFNIYNGGMQIYKANVNSGNTNSKFTSNILIKYDYPHIIGIQEGNHKANGDSNYSDGQNMVEIIKNELNSNSKGYVYEIYKHDARTYTLTRLNLVSWTHKPSKPEEKGQGLILKLPSNRHILFYNIHLFYLPDAGDFLKNKYTDAEIIRHSRDTGDYEKVFRGNGKGWRYLHIKSIVEEIFYLKKPLYGL